MNVRNANLSFNPEPSGRPDLEGAWLFSAAQAVQQSALALARAGGPGGTTYLYTDEALGTAQGLCSSLVTAQQAQQHARTTDPPTPPSSVSPPTAVRIPARPVALPPSPVNSFVEQPLARTSSGSSRCEPVLPLIASVFPTAASAVADCSHMLEIVTPPSHALQGFVCDSPQGRIAFVHLPPSPPSAPRADHLAPHFSDVLRPHDPHRPHPVPQQAAGGVPDIRENLTALLDLADTLEAEHLMLILDRDEREPAPLDELLHALMYVGGAPVRPGAPVGEWDWDPHRWALVSIEL